MIEMAGVGGGSARRNGPRFSSKNGVGRGVDAGLVDAGGRAPRLLVAEMCYPLRELRRTRHRARYAVSAVLRMDAGARDEPNFVTGDRITPSKRSTVDEKVTKSGGRRGYTPCGYTPISLL